MTVDPDALTPHDAERMMAASQARIAAKLPDILDAEQALRWLAAHIGETVELAEYPAGLPPASMLIEGVLGEPIETDALPGGRRYPVTGAGARGGFLLSRDSIFHAERHHEGHATRLQLSIR